MVSIADLSSKDREVAAKIMFAERYAEADEDYIYSGESNEGGEGREYDEDPTSKFLHRKRVG